MSRQVVRVTVDIEVPDLAGARAFRTDVLLLERQTSRSRTRGWTGSRAVLELAAHHEPDGHEPDGREPDA